MYRCVCACAFVDTDTQQRSAAVAAVTAIHFLPVCTGKFTDRKIYLIGVIFVIYFVFERLNFELAAVTVVLV